jgi:hydrogenase expression/formation protein HypC
MCLGGIAQLVEAWEEDGTRVGRLDDGDVVSLAFVPEAAAGDHVLVHLGVPVEVLEAEEAAAALALRADSPDQPGGTR